MFQQILDEQLLLSIAGEQTPYQHLLPEVQNSQ